MKKENERKSSKKKEIRKKLERDPPTMVCFGASKSRNYDGRIKIGG
jgi:hypothetical protein